MRDRLLLLFPFVFFAAQVAFRRVARREGGAAWVETTKMTQFDKNLCVCRLYKLEREGRLLEAAAL